MKTVAVMRRIHLAFLGMNAFVREGTILASLAVIAWLDVVTPTYVFLTGFYLLPIGLAIWYCSRVTAAFVIATSVGMTLYMTELAIPAGASYWSELLGYSSLITVFVWFCLLMYFLRALFVQLLEETRTDALTGLRSRRNFLESAQHEFSRSDRSGEKLTLALIDLDNFKYVNDTQGHAAGDALLVEVGRCLTAGLRVVDVVGRLGGDEFAILLPGTDVAEAGTILERLHSRLRVVLRAASDKMSASVGAVVVEPTAGLSLREIMKRADELMYSVKHGPKDRVAIKDLDI